MSLAARERARARVEPLLALARRVRDPADVLGRELRAGLARSSALSQAGIELALGEHLETEVSDADLDALAAWCAPPAPACHVLLSAQVCTAALRAIALGLVSSDVLRVKASRRDPDLARLLVRELRGELDIASVEAIQPADGDEVHAYGSDQALTSIRAALPAGLRFRGHGTGFGVAVLGEGSDLEADASELARDVVVFDQRGCLSPRVALVSGPPDRAERFAALVSQALSDLALRVPPGALDPVTSAERATFVTTMQAIGDVHACADHVVALDPRPELLLLAPAARALLVAPCPDAAAWARLIGPFGRWITCIGRSGSGPEWLDDALRLQGECRVVPLGKMQRPRLDGPVDRRR